VSDDWEIREAERRDVPDLLTIEVAQFPEPWTRAMMLDEIENIETRRYTVAVEGRTVVGYLGVMYVMDELHINTIGTLPGHEGRGVARSLMDEAWNHARLRGTLRATLEVAVSNTRAQDLYRHYGFSPVGVRKNYYERSGEDALIMWADIDPMPV
jgi:ribosomal-protein-alanine N-acetyltransferase